MSLGAACQGCCEIDSPVEVHLHQCSTGSKPEELEAIVHQENWDAVSVMETWWDDSHGWSAAVDGYRHSGRDRQAGEVVGWLCTLGSAFPVGNSRIVMIRLSACG